MVFWLWVIAAILSFVLVLLVIKIFLLRRSALRLKEGLAYRLEHETNTLLDIPSRDGAMRDLASCLNSQLILLREERWRFQQGDQALREAVTHISHDLRTPLTAIYGYLDLLETTDDLPEIRRYLWQIRGRAEAMTDLTEELFRYLILPSEHDLIFRDTDLGRVLEDTLLSFYGAFHQKNIQPEIHLPDSRVIRSLDPSCLNRILGNIVSNVLKYSDGDLIVTLNADGNMTFRNHAAALDAVQVGKLFDRFYTVENADHATGLGLSIAKTLTKRLHSSIEAQYQQGCLVITLCFP